MSLHRPHPLSTMLIAACLIGAGLAVLPGPGSLAATESDGDATTAEATATRNSMPADDEAGPRNLTLAGNLTHAETGEPVPNVTIRLDNRWMQETDGEKRYGHDSLSTTTGPDGSYAVDVSRGDLHLWIDAPGYQRTSAGFEMREGLTLDIPLRPVSEDLATIEGVVTDTHGEPIADAHVNVHEHHDSRCDGDVCYASDERSVREGDAEGERQTVVHVDDDTIVIRYEPRDDRYASTQTGEDGSYSVQVPAGNYTVRASASDHVREQTQTSVARGEIRTVDLALTPIPEDSVTVIGVVTDAETGDPIPYAEIQVENQAWGAWDHARTDEAGRFTVETKPGHLIVNTGAEETYWRPCEDAHPEPDRPMSSHADPSTSVVRPEPACDGRQDRAHSYLPQVATFQPDPEETITMDVSLDRKPQPSSTLSGWVVDAENETGIPDAYVSVRNEITGEWGRAVTDEDGSYTIDVRPGYYTVRTHAPGYLATAENVEIGDGEDVRLTLEAPPGEARYGGCCIAYAESSAGERDVAHETGGDGAAGSGASGASDGASNEPAPMPRTSSDTRDDDAMAFEGTGGGLGPYEASSHTNESADLEQTTPLVGVIGTVALVGLGAAALALYAPRRP